MGRKKHPEKIDICGIVRDLDILLWKRFKWQVAIIVREEVVDCVLSKSPIIQRKKYCQKYVSSKDIGWTRSFKECLQNVLTIGV